jgi:hypothetical protein
MAGAGESAARRGEGSVPRRHDRIRRTTMAELTMIDLAIAQRAVLTAAAAPRSIAV